MNLISHSKPYYSSDDYEAIIKCLDSRFTAARGPISSLLKKELRAYFNAKMVFLTSSGTTALILGLISNGIKPGDSVILPNYICREVFDAIKFISAHPIIVDIKRDTFTLNLDSVSKYINPNVKVIIFPHMFGIPGNVEELKLLEVPIIEDLSQGLGASIKNKKVGTFGDATILSFKSIKMMGGGEGGALLLNTQKTLDNIMSFMDGMSHYSPLLFEMSDLTAAITLSQWKKMDYFIKMRKIIARKYINSFKHLNLKIPNYSEDYSWFRFPIITNSKVLTFDSIKKEYAKNGIAVRRPVDYLLNQLMQIEGDFPISQEIIKRTISIPLYPALLEDEVNKIIKVTQEIFK